MELVGIKFGIYVYPKYRTSDLKIGSELFERLLYRLKMKTYQILDINIVTNDLLSFYVDNLESAKAADRISDYTTQPVTDEDGNQHHKIQISFVPTG